MRRALTLGLVALAVVVGLAVVVVVAWTVDSRRHEGRVVRNVELAEVDIGGMRREQVAEVVRNVAARYASAPVRVSAPKGGFVASAADLGLTVTEAATVEEAFRVGRTDPLVARIANWASSFLGSRRAAVKVAVAPAAVYRTVGELDPGPKAAPIEPTLKVQGGKLVAVAGKPGTGIDPADVVDELPDAARKGLPMTVRVDRGEVPPRFEKDDAEKLVAEGERLARTPLAVSAGKVEAKVPSATLRSWMRGRAAPDGLVLALDAQAATEELRKLLPDAGVRPEETTFTVTDDVPRIVAGKAGTGCCAAAAADLVLQALRTRPKDPVALPLTKVDPALSPEKAQSLGVKEKVGTFTTTYTAGQPRVTNIHRISDIVRGTVIEPGKTFSVNDFVGKRTTEKGFVVAGVIQDGILAEDVGGGVSQFATTLFNAAFFAGLDFGEYQSHSLYFPRYPRGREATLGFPHPDLQVKNSTAYGVVIWTSYTKTTVTVSLYSTKHIESVQSGQTEGPRGPCTRVVTQRTRTYPDGTKKTDSVAALYRPEEGVNCS